VKNNIEDSFRQQGLRKKMIESLLASGITDQCVLEAMAKIPRGIC
jgi:hypothetical protein